MKQQVGGIGVLGISLHFVTWLHRIVRLLSRGANTMAEKHALLEQAPSVLYSTVAREWRCKVDTRERLGEVQSVWASISPRAKAVPGVISVQRLCCGTCLDYKLLFSVKADVWAQWAAVPGGFDTTPLGALEQEFLSAVRALDGVDDATSQLYSIAEA